MARASTVLCAVAPKRRDDVRRDILGDGDGSTKDGEANPLSAGDRPSCVRSVVRVRDVKGERARHAARTDLRNAEKAWTLERLVPRRTEKVEVVRSLRRIVACGSGGDDPAVRIRVGARGMADHDLVRHESARAVSPVQEAREARAGALAFKQKASWVAHGRRAHGRLALLLRSGEMPRRAVAEPHRRRRARGDRHQNKQRDERNAPLGPWLTGCVLASHSSFPLVLIAPTTSAPRGAISPHG